MKKIYTILLAWFVALGAMAEVAIGTQVSVSELENGAVYTIQGYRGGDRYMYYNGSTYDQIHTTTTAYTDQVNYQWSFHKSASGTYYLYNLGAARFIGSVSGGNANIPLVAGGPVSKNFLVKESKVTGKGNVIMMTSDNGGSAMHVGNSGSGGYRIINWEGAYVSKEAEAVCAFKVVKVAEMDPALLNDLTAAVNLYEKPAPVDGLVYNLADGEYNAREDSQWRNGWTSTNAEKPSFALTAGANNVNANSTTYIGLRPGSGGCTYSFSSDQIILSIRFEALSASSTGHTITIGGEATSVGSLWKEFVIENVYNSIASFHLGGDNDADCYVRNIQVVFDDTPAPVKQDLYNTSKIDPNNLTPPYRIPGITTARNGRLITAAAELVCGTDPGYGEVDIVCRYSDNNGETWSDMIKVADGTGEESAERNIFESAFGDPAIVADRTSSEVLVVAVAGCTVYTDNGNTTRQNPNMIATIHSYDYGESWGKPVDVTEDIYSLFDSGNPMQAAFVGGGKIFQSRIVKVGQYYRLYAAMCARPNGNRVIYSDDFGRTWHALGGASALPAPGGDEPKCEELPDGRVILSSRVGGGRIYNIYTYSNTLTAEGAWGTDVKCTFEGSGKTPGGNSTNGEILIVPVQRNSDKKEMYLALQSLPTGSGRSNVGIFYKELTDMTDINTVANFSTDWNGFYEVTTKSSAYSSMDLQADDRIGFIYEETLTKFGKVNNPVSTCFPTGAGQHNFDGFDNIYVAYPLEYITNGEYSINREVNRRDYLQNYYTALTADASDEVKAAMATALNNLSAEPTTAEVDNLNFLLTIAQEGDETWCYIRYKEQGRNGPTLPNGSWGYLGDNLRFSSTQLKSDAQLWKKVPVGDGTYHIVSKTGKYLVPASTISTSTTQPTQSWTIEASDTEGSDVIYNGSVPCQIHADKKTPLINWGYNSLGAGTGARKNDAGCNFEFVEAADLSDIIFFDGDAGKVGYYTDEVIATYKEAAAAAMTAAEVEEAKAVVFASTERNMPVSGKAYTFKNVQKDGTTVRWFRYDATTGKIVLTADEASASAFVCRLQENGKYIFVCNDGKYMKWRGSDPGNTGVNDTYDATADAYTDITIKKMTTGNNITGDLSNTRYMSVWGRRNSNSEGCIVVAKSGPDFNAAGDKYTVANRYQNVPFYKDDYSSAIIMDEAPYANTPKLNSVGEGELLSANLHNKYMGTFSAPFPTVVPEGVTAYYVTKGNGYVTLNAIAPDNAIAANTGVILVGEDAGNAVMVPAAAETVATTEGNLLAHSAGAAKDMTGVANAYKFTNGAQGMGFYKFSGGTLPMNEAYLQIDDEKEAIGIRFVVECAIGAYKIATFYANDAMNIPSGVKAYVATTAPENGIITMTEIKDGIIPAKTGAVLRGEPTTYTFEPATEAGGTEVTGNLLHGYAGTAEFETVALPTDGSVNYVLTVKDGKVGFYRKDAGFKVYKNKAYLNVPESNGQARALYFEFDNGATGIVETENESEKAEIYDLAGRRVQKVQKGLYIVNGKKVLK